MIDPLQVELAKAVFLALCNREELTSDEAELYRRAMAVIASVFPAWTENKS